MCIAYITNRLISRFDLPDTAHFNTRVYQLCILDYSSNYLVPLRDFSTVDALYKFHCSQSDTRAVGIHEVLMVETSNHVR